MFDGLVLDLVAGRDAGIDRYTHGLSPAGSAVAPGPGRGRCPLQEELVGPVPALLAGRGRHAVAPDVPRALAQYALLPNG